MRVERRRLIAEHEPHQARANVPMEEVMVEFVRVATKAAKAGAVAFARAVLEQFERLLEHSNTKIPDALREASPTGQRIVQVYLGLQAGTSRRRQRGTILGLKLAGL